MTSASGLFSLRRSRRSLGHGVFQLESDRDRERERDPLHHYVGNHSVGRRLPRNLLRQHDEWASFRHGLGGPHGGSPCDLGPLQEQELSQHEYFGPNEPSADNRNHHQTANSRTTGLEFSRNEQLPGAVLQARARLLERLRGVSLAESRQGTMVRGISWDEFAPSYDFSTQSADWESEAHIEWLESDPPLADSTSSYERSFSLDSSKKPPGLTSEAVKNLQREIFIDVESDVIVGASSECCVCLEKFIDGEGLIRLPCCHRFHPACLVPWVRTCGDCPYCRSTI